MRRRDTLDRRSVAVAEPGAAQRAGEPALPPLAVVLLNRAGFGPRPGDLAAFAALGGTDAARLQAWVDQQLDPATIDDSEAEARIAASGYTTLGKSLAQLWADHVVPDNLPWQDRIRPIAETTLATFLRGVYSRRQLFEVLVEFWHNHFSVYGWEFYEAPTWVHYDRDVIRANALGNFRQLLEAVTRSTPMLLYLDNWLNSEDGPNENYARELLELHTLGDDSYFGTVPRSEVPLDGGGVQVGFVDEDVFAVTRALTGWSLDGDPWWDLESGNGGYLYRPDWHDTGAKNVLGVELPAGQPAEKDGQDVFDLLASHPATGRFVAGKLCRRLLGDFPPAALVDAAAAVFTAQAAAPDQIAQVVRTILLSPEFAATFGAKVKRPFEIVVGALRAGGADFPFIEGDSDSDTLDWLFYLTGHYPFSWHPPNGYPDVAGAWTGTSPRVMTWRLTNWLVDVEGGDGAYRLDAAAQTPAGVRSANGLVDFWIDRIFGRPLVAAVRQELVEFMAQGHNPDFDLPLDSDGDTRERLQSLLGLMFLSPDFLWR
jgi:uncharacterized protein (DUF1800 family)